MGGEHSFFCLFFLNWVSFSKFHSVATHLHHPNASFKLSSLSPLLLVIFPTQLVLLLKELFCSQAKSSSFELIDFSAASALQTTCGGLLPKSSLPAAPLVPCPAKNFIDKKSWRDENFGWT
ncbi:hypothetical protein [Desulfogranum marinum]|uniref:hypothetical protein n=1 Tax=Desulfogranum marinum TaxID=453220 RepID=UPI0019656A9C|nr:hypothetical protein [Desulfogranum marinum]MBM9511636.1 hypothetical protein [Desulfogranum marinum]